VNAPPAKILVLRFSSLGDIVMTTASLRALHAAFPSARIDMVVRSEFVDLLRFNPHVHRVMGFQKGQGWKGLVGLLNAINGERYDFVYDAHRSLRTFLLMPWIRAKKKFFFRKHYLRRALALTFKLPLLDSKRFLERFVDPLKGEGVRFDNQGPEMFVDDASESSALARSGLAIDGTLRVGIVPSAQWPGKRWPPERFRELLLRLCAETPYQIVVFGGPSDTFCEGIVAGLDANRVVNTQGKLTLLESAALLKLCRFTISNDTGLLHLSDALGIPSVLLFGPTSAALGCLPFHPLSRVVEQKLWCRPCSKNGQAPCIRTKRWCLELTEVSQVFEEALRLDRSLVGGS
jgi:ADP-heptose:LPS heptosyltransferase